MDSGYEERMKRIEEKHQALAESVQMLTADVQQLVVETAAQRQTLGSVLTAMQDLIGIVTGHERRMQNLEGR